MDGVFVAGNKGANSRNVRLPLSGTISLLQDTFYLMQVEYSSIRSVDFFTSKRLTLQMFQDGLPRSIPSESLYVSEHFTGSPIMVTVHPASHLCASMSTQTISPGTLLTAGIYSVLSLQARDAFGNSISEQQLSNHNVTAIFGGQIAEQPQFSYSTFSDTVSMHFTLMKKGWCNLQWFGRGSSISDAFYIAVIPDLPDFSSISFTEDFHHYSTAGMYIQMTLAIRDSFGNTRSFLEKNYDFSRDIRLVSNRSSDPFHYNVTLCKSNAEYVHFDHTPALFHAFFLQVQKLWRFWILNIIGRGRIVERSVYSFRKHSTVLWIQLFGCRSGVLVSAQSYEYFTGSRMRRKINGIEFILEFSYNFLMLYRSSALDCRLLQLEQLLV